MTKNCYVHIPFCTQKCNYCSFVSYPCLEKMTGYVYSLLKEISVNYGGEPLETLYIGGGTPSLVPIDLLKKILNKFLYVQNPEITVEVNPEDVTEELITAYMEMGINRISMGVQSLDDKILQIAGRRHTSKRALEAIDIIQSSGCKNLSLDLIYGLPSQTRQSFIKDVKCLLDYSINHISLYGLKIEEDSAFGKTLPLQLPDDDAQADMYQEVCELLPSRGFIQYEVSNFAQIGFESRHNMNYWNNNSYYGFGVAAHGYVDGFRYYNTSSLHEYMEKPDVTEYAHHVTDKERLEEEIFLGMRRVSELDIAEINQKYNIDFLKKFDVQLKKYLGEFLLLENGTLKFTTQGFLLSNVILSDFI